MFNTKLCVVFLMFTITGRCEGNSSNSSSPLGQGPAASRRMSDEQAAALRRQLMRDNYDYAQSDDERKHTNVSEKRDDTAKIYYQKDGTDHLPETAELTQTDSALEHAQYEQDGHLEQSGQYEPNRGQYERLTQYGQQGQRGQYGPEDQPVQYIRSKDAGRSWSEQEHLEQQGQFNEQDQAQYEEQTDRAKPSYADADKLTVRDIQPQYPPDHRDANIARRHIEPLTAREVAYNPSYHKQRNAFNPEEAETGRPFSDLRGDFKEQYGQNDAVGPEQAEQAENAEFNPEEQEAIDQQNISDSQDDGSDYSENKHKQPSRELYDAFGHTTRARLHRTRHSNRGRDSLSYQDRNALPGRNHHGPPGRNYQASPGRTHHMPIGRNHHEHPGRSRHAASGRNYQAPSDRNYQAPLDRNYQAPLDRNNQAPSDRNKQAPSDRNYQTPLDRNNQAPLDRNYQVPSDRNYQVPSDRYNQATLDRNYQAPLERNYQAPSNRNYQAPSDRYNQATLDRNYQAPSGLDHNPPLDHNISKKDLLYYMDDTQLRRQNTEMSPDVPDEEVVPSSPSPQPSASPSSPQVSPTSPRASPATAKPLNHRNAERAHRSFVVTVSPTNVTYKLLTLKTREGRRRGTRRILEERGPGGVAIISLDHAPLPAFRLPRSRRQYMHDHHHRRL